MTFKELNKSIPLGVLGTTGSRAGCSKLAESAAIAADLESSLDESGVTDLG